MTGREIMTSTETQGEVAALVKTPVWLSILVLDFCAVMNAYINSGMRPTWRIAGDRPRRGATAPGLDRAKLVVHTEFHRATQTHPRIVAKASDLQLHSAKGYGLHEAEDPLRHEVHDENTHADWSFTGNEGDGKLDDDRNEAARTRTVVDPRPARP
jgi:hypothetical protein